LICLITMSAAGADQPPGTTDKTPKLTNKEIVQALFTDPEPFEIDKQKCTMCGNNIKQKKSSGYNNLVQHAATHSEWEKTARAVLESKGKLKPSIELFLDKDSPATLVWIELVVMSNLPFRIVEDPVVLKNVKAKPVSRGVLQRRLVKTADIVGQIVAAELNGKPFALVFDGFTEGAEHCLCVFAATADSMRFLTFTQFENAASMTASEHIICLDTILDKFGLDIANLICLVGDNMSTNRCISKRTSVPFVGCAAHRLNLAVKAFLKDNGYIDQLKRLSSLMRKLRSVSRWPRLKAAGCPLKPVVLHEIRWTGYNDILERYLKIRPFLYLFEEDVEVDESDRNGNEYEHQNKSVLELIPSPSEHTRLTRLHSQLSVFSYVTSMLQSPRRTIAETRDLFDLILRDHPELKHQIGINARVVESPAFESIVVKLQNKVTLSRSERAAAARLWRPAASKPAKTITTNQSQCQPAHPVAEEMHREFKRQRAIRESGTEGYIDTTWIPPTSVTVERCFSQVKIITGYLRRSLLVTTKDALLMLRFNWDLLSPRVVSRAIEESRGGSSGSGQSGEASDESDGE